MSKPTLDQITALAKRRGFVFQGSEIYGGLANVYDYGPIGALLLRNIRNLWWKNFVDLRLDIVGLDASIISHENIWKASGHVASFADAMVDCKNCKTRTRADHLIEDYFEKKGVEKKVEGLAFKELDELIQHNSISCSNCGKSDWTLVRMFNLLFPVQLGILEENNSLAYLRGETAQGMFVNFKNILDSTRVKLPFGIAQLGKGFRNEITKGSFIFRTVEFELAEIEYFFDPEVTDWTMLYEQWKHDMWKFLTQKLGVNEKNMRWRIHSDKERSFYSKRTEDLEYHFPFGFKELWGLAYRTDYDLQQQMKFSRRDLTYIDPKTGKRFAPHTIEPAVGVTRLFLMLLCDAYWYDEEKKRVVLKFHKDLSPYRCAVFPLLSNKPELVTKAQQVFHLLVSDLSVAWDERGNIGKRYLSQDEIGTPYCVTVDFQTLTDDTVTVRDRDTALQHRVDIAELKGVLS